MPSRTEIHIMLADDHNSTREGYAKILGEIDNFKVTGQAPNGLELIRLIEANQPHVVLLDLDMPVMNGKEALKIIKRRFKTIRVIILSMHNDDLLISDLLKAGASAYLAKNCFFEDIINTINKVYKDYYYFDRSVSKLVVRHAISDNDFINVLTSQEIDVLKQICNGKSYIEVAGILGISINTVKYHQKSIYRKTELSSIVDLVKYAIKNGISDLNN